MVTSETIDVEEINEWFKNEEQKMLGRLFYLRDFDNMKFYIPNEMNFLSNCIDPNKFLKDCIKRGVLEEITHSYQYDTIGLCNNAAAYIILQLLKKSHPLAYSIQIVEGEFNYKNHTWLQLGEYYVDLTLAQFVKNAPCLAITKVKESQENELYQPKNVYADINDWLMTLE